MATLRKILDEKRNAAEKAEALEVANQIWQVISKKLQSFLEVEYERLEYVSVVISVKDHELVLSVNTKDSLTKNITREERLTQVIRLSAKKLEELDIIMYVVTHIAEREDIEVWHDTGDYAIEYDARSWGFMWYNDNIKS